MIKSIMDGGRYAKSFHLMNLVSLIYTLNETCSHLSNSVKLFPKSKSSGQCLLKLVFLQSWYRLRGLFVQETVDLQDRFSSGIDHSRIGLYSNIVEDLRIRDLDNSDPDPTYRLKNLLKVKLKFYFLKTPRTFK